MRFLITKLIEFMIVVGIIGTISVLGLNMYQNVSGGAKSNSVKTNHNTVVQYLTLELMRCNISPTVMDGNLICKGRTRDSVMEAAINAFQHLKNPFGKGDDDLDDTLITYGGTYTEDYDVGYVRLNQYENSNEIEIGSCYAIKCDSGDEDNNYAVSYINIYDEIDANNLQGQLKELTQGNLSEKIEELQKDNLTKKLLKLPKKFLNLPKQFLPE